MISFFYSTVSTGRPGEESEQMVSVFDFFWNEKYKLLCQYW